MMMMNDDDLILLTLMCLFHDDLLILRCLVLWPVAVCDAEKNTDIFWNSN